MAENTAILYHISISVSLTKDRQHAAGELRPLVAITHVAFVG